MEVLEGKLAVKDVATRIRDIVQAGNAVRSALRAEREALAHEYENARLRLINVQVPKSGSGPVQGQSGNAAPPQAASPAPAQSSNAPKYCAIYGDKSESCEQLTFADCWQKPHCLGVDPDLTHRCLKRSDGGWYCGKPQ